MCVEYKIFINKLKAGCSKDPLEILMDAGVDLRTREPFTKTMEHFSKCVNELERLIVKEKKIENKIEIKNDKNQ
jgi:oligoendopeptidase F